MQQPSPVNTNDEQRTPGHKPDKSNPVELPNDLHARQPRSSMLRFKRRRMVCEPRVHHIEYMKPNHQMITIPPIPRTTNNRTRIQRRTLRRNRSRIKHAYRCHAMLVWHNFLDRAVRYFEESGACAVDGAACNHLWDGLAGRAYDAAED